jgi:hypothetical protein
VHGLELPDVRVKFRPSGRGYKAAGLSPVFSFYSPAV